MHWNSSRISYCYSSKRSSFQNSGYEGFPSPVENQERNLFSKPSGDFYEIPSGLFVKFSSVVSFGNLLEFPSRIPLGVSGEFLD